MIWRRKLGDCMYVRGAYASLCMHGERRHMCEMHVQLSVHINPPSLCVCDHIRMRVCIQYLIGMELDK